MRIHLISVGNRMPRWVVEGYGEYAKRMPPECSLRLVEVGPGRRGKGTDLRRAIADEGTRLLRALPHGALTIALDVRGRSWSTEQLAGRLGKWLAQGRDLALLVGGPDGLSDECLERADGHWSLSALTFPHPLVRVLLAEQFYRAWSLLKGHPYHRG